MYINNRDVFLDISDDYKSYKTIASLKNLIEKKKEVLKKKNVY